MENASVRWGATLIDLSRCSPRLANHSCSSTSTVHSFQLRSYHLAAQICCFSYCWTCISIKVFHLFFFFLFFFIAENASYNKSNHDRWLFWQPAIDNYLNTTRRMSFTYIPTDVSAMSALSVWLVMYCICLLTSLFIYRCLACNHGWHETPWCKLWRVNIPISLPAFAATETWIRARHVTHTSYWWERQQTGCS